MSNPFLFVTHVPSSNESIPSSSLPEYISIDNTKVLKRQRFVVFGSLILAIISMLLLILASTQTIDLESSRAMKARLHAQEAALYSHIHATVPTKTNPFLVDINNIQQVKAFETNLLVPVESPTSAPNEENPTNAPNEGNPTSSPNEENPTNAPNEGNPTPAPDEENPTQAPVE